MASSSSSSSSSKIAALLLISMLSVSPATPILHSQCGSCSTPHHHHQPHPKTPKVKPPITVPKVPVPPVVDPPKWKPCPPPPAAASCPIDSVKMGACVDLLGGLVHIGMGDPAANKCCPIMWGLVEVEAAMCMCNALKLKAFNLNIYVPIALELLVTCGKTPPPGFTCSI